MQRNLEEYLETPPWEAFIQMVNDYYPLELNPTLTDLCSIERISGEKTRVTLSISRYRHRDQLLPPFTVRAINYYRLDLSTFFTGRLTLPLKLDKAPVTTRDIVDVIGAQLKIVFDRNDFKHKLIEPGSKSVTLEAHPRSLRWVGAIDLPLTY